MRLTYAVFERGDANCRGKIGEEARSATVGSPHLDSHLQDGWGMKRNREEDVEEDVKEDVEEDEEGGSGRSRLEPERFRSFTFFLDTFNH